MANFKAEDKTLQDVLFGHDKFRVPQFQRPYSWTTDQAEDFWEDLESSKESSFIGSFVLNSEFKRNDGYIEIVDGQQRLLTTTIFIAALRDVAEEELKDKDLAVRIQRMSIAFENMRGEYEYRIVGGESIKDFFVKYIQNPETAGKADKNKLGDEEKLIVDNYEYFKGLIKIEISRKENKKDKQDIIQNLWTKVAEIRVIRILLENEDDAYAVFETVNARGADLTVADLLKNHIFKNLKDRDSNTEGAINKWSQLCSNIEETNVELTRFIRQYWLSKYGYVGEKELYREIKKNITDYSLFLDELLVASEWYNKLLSGDKTAWKDVDIIDGRKVFRSLLGIRAMDVKQCFVIFLSLARNKDSIGSDTSNIFLLIENFTFAYSTIGKQQANRVEKIYSKIAVGIEEAANTQNEKLRVKNIQRSLSQLKDELYVIWPKEVILKENFSELGLKKSQKSRILIKYILSKIDESIEKREFDLDFDVVNLEHILPQNPTEWGLTKTTIRGYVNKIGNLTLVHKDYNSAAGNKKLSEKLLSLQKTNIPSTKNLIQEIEKEGVWNEKTIEKRQVEMGALAFEKVWTK